MVEKDAGLERPSRQAAMEAATAGHVGEPYYHRTFKLKGSNRLVRGYLTYELGKEASSERLLCLVNQVDGLVPEEYQDEYSAFIQEIEASRLSGRIAKTKSFVVRLRKEHALGRRFPQALIAVHKLGPVPAFDTGLRQLVELHGQIVEARIVAYQNPRQGADEDPSEEGQKALLESLDHDDLHLCLQRYYEDVAVQLADIANYGNLPRTLKWSKQCEHLIGQSLTSKLNVMSPGEKKPRDSNSLTEWEWWKSPAGERLDGLQGQRKAFFEKHADQVFLALYVRNTFLFLLNSLYAHVGISSRRKIYRDRYKSLREHFQRYFGKGFLETVGSTIPEFLELRRLLTAYETNSTEELYEPSPLQVRIQWIDDLTVFMRLLYWLKKSAEPPHKARLFLSYQHNVPESLTLANQIDNHVRQHYSADFSTLMVRGDEPSSLFKERIKSAIWQADRLSCVITRDPRKTGGQEPADDGWIAREAEHGVLQGKRVIFLRQDGITVAEFVGRMIQRPIDFLLPEARIQAAQRIAGLRRECEDYPHVNFHLANGNSEPGTLDWRVAERLESERRALLDSRHAHLVSGYLMQFSQDVCEVFAELLPLARYPVRLSKSALVDQLAQRKISTARLGLLPRKKIEAAVAAAWKASRQRSLEIGGETYRILTFTEKTFSIELNRILRALNPQITPDEIEKLEFKLLKDAAMPREG